MGAGRVTEDILDYQDVVSPARTHNTDSSVLSTFTSIKFHFLSDKQ